MNILKKYYSIIFIAILLLFNPFYSRSMSYVESAILDSSNYIIVNSISIIGNEKTKPHIILRELNFTKGDTLFLKDTSTIIQSCNNKLYNTTLFNSTKFYFNQLNETGLTDVIIDIEERWYIWPSPIFELGDRNFNEWWQDRNRSTNRLDYGLRFRWENFRGRAELLKIVLQTGFTNKFELFHTIPYINKKQQIGIRYGASYSTNSKVAYNTIENKLAYLNDDKTLRKRFYSFFETTYRPQFYTQHSLNILYKNNSIHDTLSLLNPNYFTNTATKQQFITIGYYLSHNKTNIQAYPTKGYLVEFSVEQSGIGFFNDVNILSSTIGSAVFKSFDKKLSSAHKVYLKTSNTSKIPYFNMEGMGYNQNFVRGFERNVIDAQHYTYTRNALRYKFASVKQNADGIIPIKQFEKIPYAFYLTSFIDAGTAKFSNTNTTNTLNGTLLLGYGIGLDIVTYYDIVLRFEYSFTNKATKGLFFHFEQAF